MTDPTVRPQATQGTASQPRTPTSSRWRRWVLGYWWCLAVLLPAMARADMLDDLISQVLVSHPATRSQRALVASATAGVDSARWQFYPTPSARLEVANTSPTDRLYQGDIQSSTLSLQQPLWTGGRLSSGLNKARAALTVSEAGLEEVRHKLALQVLQAYGEWMSASLQTLANEKSLATHVRLREQVERRIAQGASAHTDLVLAVARLELIFAEVTAARARAQIALAHLEQLLGGPVDAPGLFAALAEPRALNGTPQVLLDRALTINPSVQKSRAQAQERETVIGERRADYSPEIYVRFEEQFGNHNFPDAGAQSRVFVGLSTRFGAGLSALSNVEEAQANYQSALAEIEVQTRAVSDQVLSDQALVVSSAIRYTALKTSLQAAGEVSASYDRQFLAGRKSWLDVMNAARELAQTATQLAEVQATQVVATWRLVIYTSGVGAVTGKTL